MTDFNVMIKYLFFLRVGDFISIKTQPQSLVLAISIDVQKNMQCLLLYRILNNFSSLIIC